jgi:hypothetical protein
MTSSSGLRGHRRTYLTISESADHALGKMLRYILLRPLRPELDVIQNNGRVRFVGISRYVHSKVSLITTSQLRWDVVKNDSLAFHPSLHSTLPTLPTLPTPLYPSLPSLPLFTPLYHSLPLFTPPYPPYPSIPLHSAF